MNFTELNYAFTHRKQMVFYYMKWAKCEYFMDELSLHWIDENVNEKKRKNRKTKSNWDCQCLMFPIRVTSNQREHQTRKKKQKQRITSSHFNRTSCDTLSASDHLHFHFQLSYVHVSRHRWMRVSVFVLFVFSLSLPVIVSRFARQTCFMCSYVTASENEINFLTFHGFNIMNALVKFYLHNALEVPNQPTKNTWKQKYNLNI